MTRTKNNINYALKWVRSENEAEIKNAYTLMMKSRKFAKIC